MALVIHNFMDAEGLERDRCESCVFMVATENGPLSMCVHNARRDHHILTPARVETPRGTRWWNAATGELSNTPQSNEFGAVPFKHLMGRMRAAASAEETE